jgi:aminopeptidase S
MLVAGFLLLPSATAGTTRSGVAPLTEVADVLRHLEKLQSIAESSGGNRAAGTEGYARSVEYVAQTLSAAGFEVERQKCGSCTGKGDENVIADWPGGDAQSTVMFGAHLDSVEKGPGADDNASGSAALLETALTLAKSKPDMVKHARFAWWASEEQEDEGSTHYVENSDTDTIDAYINLDMVASPNSGYFVTYSDTPLGKAVSAHLSSVGRTPETMKAGCDCSDDAVFDDAGIPTTYLTTASNDEDDMTAEQAAKWDGEAGEPYDACYHRACDAYPGNIDKDALGHTTNTVTNALWTLAVRS